MMSTRGQTVRDFYAIDLLEVSGRLAYDELVQVTRTVSERDFVSQFKQPLFVGSSLYTGQFMDTNGGMDATMAFVFCDPDGTIGRENTPDPAGLRRAIYPLLRKRSGPKAIAPNIYTVGRTSANDLVMTDFAMSRHHAEIRLKRDRYFIKDCKATNGCARNHERIAPGQEIEIFTGDMISFGRFIFYFTPAHEVYEQLRKS
jgi:hypothetical protein